MPSMIIRKPTSGPLAETYNLGWLNHPNFSWKQNQPQNQGRISNQAHTQYASRFPSQAQNQFQSSHQAQPAPQLSLEETLQAFIQTSNQNIQQHSQNIQQHRQNIQELQKVTMNNSQIMQELKNVTLSNSRTIQELKNEFIYSKQFRDQAISKIEGQIGQLATQMGEGEIGKFPNQPVPNPKVQFVIGSTSGPSHGQQHV
jgi:hypothetical protein